VGLKLHCADPALLSDIMPMVPLMSTRAGG